MAGEQLGSSSPKPERLAAGSVAARAGLPAQPQPRDRSSRPWSRGLCQPSITLDAAWCTASTLQWGPATPGCTGSAGEGVCYSSVRRINGHRECKNGGSFARCAPLLLSWNINQKGLCVILEF